MEAILARALEYTLKYWLKSFSRDQLKLQGRSVQLSNLDINGEALHASMGLPPAINVTRARVRRFEINLPYVSNVQVDPIVILIDNLDLVLEENGNLDASNPSSSIQPSNSVKGGTYGFADKIADGMTVQITTVNLLLETHGSVKQEDGAAWAPPLASITIRNLVLYTTNENWQLVNLKEARDFSINKNFIYVFKKLEWESLSIDLLPHPDMFADVSSTVFQEGGTRRDKDGAKRVFFGGERFVERISGEAYITVQRTEQNSPLGLEVQVHVTDVVCPALSEPGLRALLRFLTGLYVCLSRGDVDFKQRTETAGLSLVSVLVDHIFLCIKDAEFQLELLLQSLLFSRATVFHGEVARNLTSVKIGSILLRDVFSDLPCALVQLCPQPFIESDVEIPDFARNFCPPIHPVENKQWPSSGSPLMCLHSLQVKPAPQPPKFASETVIVCQPIMFHLQEESCLRISSFLVDGVMAVNHGNAGCNHLVNSLELNLKELNVTIPADVSDFKASSNSDSDLHFSGARLQIENLSLSESPSLKLRQLSLEKDPACFLLWHGQPYDSSQKKWAIRTSHLALSLETSCSVLGHKLTSKEVPSGMWRCLEVKDASIEIAMVSEDGSPLIVVPPPGGIVRVGILCEHILSNTSVEQLFFVLELYAYFGRVWDKVAAVRRTESMKNNESLSNSLPDRVPCDTAVSLALNSVQLQFLESSVIYVEGVPLVKFLGEGLHVKVSHRMLGGAVVISSTVRLQSVTLSCVETDRSVELENDNIMNSEDKCNNVAVNGCHPLRPVFWVYNWRKSKTKENEEIVPLCNINLVHVIPLTKLDRGCHSLSVSACISGVRLSGGMSYAESLLHRFGIFGPDGGPGVGLSDGLENLSRGPFSKLFRTSHLLVDDIEEDNTSKHKDEIGYTSFGIPDDVDVNIEMKDWLFALEGAQDMRENKFSNNIKRTVREESFWHATFHNFQVKAVSEPKKELNAENKKVESPFETVNVMVEGLQVLKPRGQKIASVDANEEKITSTSGGIYVEALMMLTENICDDEMGTWVMDNLKFSVKEPIEAVVTKDELQHLTVLFKSEVDATGRITAGIIKLLKLDKTIGRTTLIQLSNLGSESLDRIFLPDNLGHKSSPICVNYSLPSNMIDDTSRMESTFSSIEEAILESQLKCKSLISELSASEYSQQHVVDIRTIAEKLESIKYLVNHVKHNT